ncbi:LysR family transcriptional regulator [Ferrimonas balearica]|uniref:LysR family transcriptional regulator n=1 Tax=Ferrimonas balearica TaxID=44012 RepID=UPI001C9A22F9|nr:LysR family transcriptional regulator [Ferrimonas balearica]MBY5994023.1 LysR family transcriptional regulator [Ferrimonas balearica]
MAKDRFQNLDLNLLKTLQVLAQEGNMRRAAERLHVTQPAVSHALQRLRHHFEDELFIKVRGGMAPTQVAQALLERLKPALEGLAEAVNDAEAFDPAQLDSRLRIALAPHLAYYFGAELFRAIHRVAPKASLELVDWGVNTQVQLLNGELDLAVNINVTGLSKELVSAPLITETGALLVHHSHPFQGERITPAQLAPYGLACLINPGVNDRVPLISKVLEAHGESAQVRFRSTSPQAILNVLRQQPYCYPMSRLVMPKQDPEFRLLELDVARHYLEHSMLAYYHRGHSHPAVTLWLVQTLAQMLRHSARQHLTTHP